MADGKGRGSNIHLLLQCSASKKVFVEGSLAQKRPNKTLQSGSKATSASSSQHLAPTLKSSGNQDQKDAISTQCSQAVTHPSTNWAQRCLTSVIGRELVCSTWYGRWRRQSVWIRLFERTTGLYAYSNDLSHVIQDCPKVKGSHS